MIQGVFDGEKPAARSLAVGRESHYFDLESPRDLLRLQNPALALSPLRGLLGLTERDLFAPVE